MDSAGKQGIKVKTLLLCILLLAGCAQVAELFPGIVSYDPPVKDAQGYRWERGGPIGTPVIHRGVDVYLNCMFEEKAEACAVQGRGDGLCHVYLSTNPEPWHEAHERKHCEGWRHPNAQLRVRSDGRVETVRF